MVEARRWRTRRWRIVAAIALLLAVVGWWYSAYPWGMIAAWVDGIRGHDKIKALGLPSPWAWEYAQLIKQRYGVEIEAVAGCVVTRDQVWYVDGYNSVARPRIVARYGKDIFAECAEEARAAWKQVHAQE